MRGQRIWGLAAILVMWLVVPVSPQQSPAQQFEARKAQQGLHQELDAIDNLLAKGESKRAYRKATSLLGRMKKQLVGSKSAAPLLTAALVRHAVAAYEHDANEAIWHWQVAQQLWPGVNESLLSQYGNTGEALGQHTVRKPIEKEAPPTPRPANPNPQQIVQPPEPIDTPFPLLGIRRPEAHFEVEVEFIIDTDGHVKEPRILAPVSDPVLAYVALDSLRKWRFRPATLGERNVEVVYRQTMYVDFR